MRCSPRLACITSLAVRRCPASLPPHRGQKRAGAAAQRQMRTLAAARVDSLLLGPALWLAGVGSGSERRNGSAAASWLSGGRSLQLSAALPSRPLYLGRLLRRGDSAVGHPPSLLWACRRESTVGSQAARAGPKGVVQQGVGRGRSSGWATQRPCGWRVLLDARSHTSVHGLSLAVAHRRPSPLRAQTTSRWALRAARCSGAAC